MSKLLRLALLAFAAACLGLALVLPILTTEIDYVEAVANKLGPNTPRAMLENTFRMFAGSEASLVDTTQVSVLSGAQTLFERGAYASFVLVFGFSVVLPVLKIALFAYSEISRTTRRQVQSGSRLLMAFHKWSLLDVLVVSAVVFTLSEIPFLKVDIASAAYWYLGYVITVLAYHQVTRSDDTGPLTGPLTE